MITRTVHGLLPLVLALVVGCSPPPGRPSAEPDPAEAESAGGEQTAEAPDTEPAGSGDEGDTSPEAQAVSAAWDGYKNALVDRDGEAAAGLVTPETLTLYDEWRRLALHSTEEDLHERAAPARLSALLFRQQVEAERLAEMDGRQLFAAAVDGGWVGSDIPAEVRVTRIDGDQAYVNLIQDGRALPVELPLVRRVENDWKVDIARLVEITEPQITAVVAQLAQQRGTDEDAALLYIVQSTTGEAASEELWTPPQPEEGGDDEAGDDATAGPGEADE